MLSFEEDTRTTTKKLKVKQLLIFDRNIINFRSIKMLSILSISSKLKNYLTLNE